MGATYTRQSSYSDGDTITAAHTNDEFNQLLAAFASSTGHTHDGTTAEGGPITKLLGNTLTFGAGTAGTDITVTFDGESNDGVLKWMEDEDYFEFSDDILIASTEKIQFRDTAIHISSTTDGQLDLVADTEIQIAATTVDINGNVDISGTLTIGSAGISEAELEILDGATVTTDELNILDGVTATTAELNIMDGVTATTAELNILDGVTSTTSELNLVDGITAGTVSASKAVIVDSNKDVTGFRNITATGDVVVGGDLTVTGDDITMGTNTSGNLLVADGTNFNSIAVGDLSEISTVANDDVFLAVDTSGGGLKKITRSAIVSGLATSGAISNVSEDTTPQLGGNLDMNGNDIVTTSNANIELAANGTGKVVVKGNSNQGAIQLNCEANSHGQIIIAAPHSESASNTLTLPSTGGDARLVSTSSTATLTNKTLTDPVITNMTGSTITLDSAGDITLDADGADIVLKDGGTTFGSMTNSSGELVIKSGSTPTTAMTFSGANVTFAGTVTIGSAGISEAELEILDGATVTTDELNILDGVTSTASEINLVDGSSAGTIVNSKAVIYGSSGEVNATTLQIAGTSITSTAAELNILDGVTSTTAELNILDGVTSTAAELNILDGVTATATELNIMDGDTSASSTTLVDADRVVTNDNGTMKQVALTDVKTYLTSAGFSSDDPTALAIALG